MFDKPLKSALNTILRTKDRSIKALKRWRVINHGSTLAFWVWRYVEDLRRVASW